MTQSVHFCYKRCNLCKPVHDVGKCGACNELTNLLRSKADKNDFTSETVRQLNLGEVKRRDDRECARVTSIEIEKERGLSFGGGEVDVSKWVDHDSRSNEVSVATFERVGRSPDDPAHAVKLLPG
ncbi:hypothetical protein PHMEG_00013756 [Phytophthora megakarya]|uniref:Uncharacterized protein n=1 Tax=Phytophthora megakarya TaxID=4795 RepID=A0A225W6J3_9STRA|nr:hypothetical protein PHMEG_00013756 [Phytophthora megakarya]